MWGGILCGENVGNKHKSYVFEGFCGIMIKG